MSNLYRKKPVVIEAVLWTGNNWLEVNAFAKTKHIHIDANGLAIDTLEGQMRADVGDWIIRGVKGELYPCKPDVFAKTYEPVEST